MFNVTYYGTTFYSLAFCFQKKKEKSWKWRDFEVKVLFIKNEEEKKITKFVHFFQCVAIIIKALLKISISYLVYNKIWLYGPRDDC
jgi:hypothetical protein